MAEVLDFLPLCTNTYTHIYTYTLQVLPGLDICAWWEDSQGSMPSHAAK